MDISGKNSINGLKINVYINLIVNMYASSEKKILRKNFTNNFFEKCSLWSYMDKKDYRRHITFKWDNKKEKYFFSFPLNNNDYNYVVYFDTHAEASEYIKFIINDYLE